MGLEIPYRSRISKWIEENPSALSKISEACFYTSATLGILLGISWENPYVAGAWSCLIAPGVLERYIRRKVNQH